jgi:Tol biopolymer transport system component
VWTRDVDGGAPVRLTATVGNANVPTWSRDGRSVYFTAQHDGQRSISRVPATGGAPERVVDLGPGSGASRVRESADGRTLFFKRISRPSPLFAYPLAGGPQRTIVECVRGVHGFEVTERGLYYATCSGSEGEDSQLHRLDLASGQDRALGTLEKYRYAIAVSPDEKTVVYVRVPRTDSDLMLVEGFR